MILRRVTEHIKAQNWFAVGIDFVIVVFGVFVGIQVSNWNQAQADQRLGRAYAERLTADLQKDLVSRRALADYYGAVLDSVERTNSLLAAPQSDPQELVVSAYRASEISYGPQTRADTARLALDTVTDTAYRHRVRTIIPLEVQKALRAGCSDVRNEVQEIVGFMPECTLDVDPELIVATAAALRADPVVQAELRYQYSDVFSARANISGDAVFLELALAALRSTERPDAEDAP
jgi:hypothetical protein